MKKTVTHIVIVALLLSGCGKESDATGPMPEDEFLIIAHRGASAYVPENTLASYAMAEKLDANYSELDIHLTKDGEVVVMHDKDVVGTTEAHGDIADFTLDELKKLSADFRYAEEKLATTSGSNEMYAVPTLREVFSRFGDKMHFVIELKDPKEYPGIEEKLVTILQECDMIDFDDKGQPKAVIQSFDTKGLKRIHKLNKDIPLLKLISFDEDETATLTAKEIDKLGTYAAGIGVSYEALTTEFIANMQESGLAVYAYTINDAETALKMKAIGANGIHTDRPDLLGN